MADQKLILKKETLPTRCEICHQADMFHPETGVCQRCQPFYSEVARPVHQSPTAPNFEQFTEQSTPMLLVLRIFLLAGFALLIGGVSCAVGSNVPQVDFLIGIGILALLVSLVCVGIGVVTGGIFMAAAFVEKACQLWRRRREDK